MTRGDVRNNQWSLLVTGLLVLSAGVLFWMDQIGRLEAREYLEWWPVALLAIGVAHLLDRRWAASVVWLAIGLLFLARTLGFERPSLWMLIGLWPLLLTVAGITLISQALRPGRTTHDFTATAFMAGNVRRLASPTAGGQAIAVMGGCDIHVMASALKGEELVIDVLAFWGGVVIHVPRGWTVEDRVVPILGALEDKTARGSAGGGRLVVSGSAIMGGVEVRNFVERAV